MRSDVNLKSTKWKWHERIGLIGIWSRGDLNRAAARQSRRWESHLSSAKSCAHRDRSSSCPHQQSSQEMYETPFNPQVLSPPLSLPTIPPPPLLFTPPNPRTFISLLQDLFILLLHTLLQPFSTKLIPCAPSHPYATNIFPPQQSTGPVVPIRKERRTRSKSPVSKSASASPTTSLTLTEGTFDGDGIRGRRREAAIVGSGVSGGFEVSKVRIRSGKRWDGMKSKHEDWAKEAFKL